MGRRPRAGLFFAGNTLPRAIAKTEELFLAV